MNEIGELGGMDTFIQDIQCILKDINETQSKKRTEIKEHFQNIASNPEHSYSAKEQVAILLEIMNCYNTNIVEYQKNMRELGIITKNLIKAHNNRSFSDESHTSDETILTGSSSSLYDYFIQLIWGKHTRKTAVEPGREPSVDLANIFVDTENNIIDHSFADATKSNNASENRSSQNVDSPHIFRSNANENDIPKKRVNRRNTIQPIIKHIPHM